MRIRFEDDISPVEQRIGFKLCSHFGDDVVKESGIIEGVYFKGRSG